MPGLQITVGRGHLEIDRKHVRRVLTAAGREIATTARSLIRKSAGGGRTYYLRGASGGQGRYQASSPGQPPSSLSGALASSIKVIPFESGEGVAVRDMKFYALFLEQGAHGGGGNTRAGNLHRTKSGRMRMNAKAVGKTRVLQPRPFLTTALEQRSASIELRVGLAIAAGLKFAREKRR